MNVNSNNSHTSNFNHHLKLNNTLPPVSNNLPSKLQINQSLPQNLNMNNIGNNTVNNPMNSTKRIPITL
jgi:hypothetical protein